jgi:thioredoxin 1
MLPSLVIPILVGATLGAALGYFGQCSSGTCPLTSTWWRGALYGGGMGLLFGLVSPQVASGNIGQTTKNVKLIGQSDFDTEVIQSSTPVVVDFFATWCGPCKTLAPRIDKIADQFSGKVKFVKVNIDQSRELADKYNIQGVPTLLFIQKGKIVDGSVGLPSASALKQKVEALAAKTS